MRLYFKLVLMYSLVLRFTVFCVGGGAVLSIEINKYTPTPTPNLGSAYEVQNFLQVFVIKINVNKFFSSKAYIF